MEEENKSNKSSNSNNESKESELDSINSLIESNKKENISLFNPKQFIKSPIKKKKKNCITWK